MGAVRREDKAHLRTRVGASGMDYKGYNIAVHEFGHNVEQTFSLAGIDRWSLAGVPNSAFTEALAMIFQDRDLEVLGVAPPSDARDVEALGALWAAYEIGGVALVDAKAWHWMYDHSEATPAQLREAVLASARDVWNRFYAPVFGQKDVEILAIYSHMVSYPSTSPTTARAHHRVPAQREAPRRSIRRRVRARPPARAASRRTSGCGALSAGRSRPHRSWRPPVAPSPPRTDERRPARQSQRQRALSTGRSFVLPGSRTAR